MERKILIICMDAFGPEYLERSPTPNVDRMRKEGFFVIGQGVVPSVTNTEDLGVSSLKWRDIYLANDIHLASDNGTLRIGAAEDLLFTLASLQSRPC